MNNGYEKRCPTCEGLLEEGDVTYCKYCIPSPKSKEPKKKTARQKIAEKYPDDRIFVELECITCHHVSKVRIHKNMEELYKTDKVKKSWECLVCKSKATEGTRKHSGWGLTIPAKP